MCERVHGPRYSTHDFYVRQALQRQGESAGDIHQSCESLTLVTSRGECVKVSAYDAMDPVASVPLTSHIILHVPPMTHHTSRSNPGDTLNHGDCTRKLGALNTLQAPEDYTPKARPARG
jgi:hypothetical protein